MLKKRDDCAIGMLERTIQRTKQATLTKAKLFHLLEKGIYKEAVRDTVRYLFQVGVSGNYVNGVIHVLGKLFGMDVVGNVSCSSVARFIREGGIAAKIQVGYEISEADTFTLSGDGTTHRAINYNSRHISLKVDDHTTGEASHKTRFLGIMPSLDGSSAESIKDWEKMLGNISDLLSRSPFAQRHHKGTLHLAGMFAKLVGVNSDHCSKEKKDAQALKAWKEDAVHQVLGEKKFLDMDDDELLAHFIKAREKMVKAVGGEEAWGNLAETEQAERKAEMFHSIIMELGKESLELMSDDEKRILKLFIWAGCGCHKELDTVRGGYAAMVQYYSEHGHIPRPILLANRDNAAVLEGVTSEDDVENEMTGSGGIKCAQLAGAVLDNKLDKKGHHDLFRWWWKKVVNKAFTFPDTSNTRFGSYCEAAIELINLWDALHDTPTLCELLVLGLYAETVGKHYMAIIRAHAKNGTNMLMLGPLHDNVRKHLEVLHWDPEQLLSGDVDTLHLIAVLYGQEWQRPDFIRVVHSMAPTLPHLSSLLRAFFSGAGKTWERFTSEFAPGGLIDEASLEEKELAWMLPTNDINEGALGSFRVMMCRQPQLSLSGQNAQAMYFRNETQTFMKQYFVKPEDLQFLCSMAWESTGEDQKREQEIIEHSRQRAAEKEATRKKRQQKRQEKDLQLEALELVLDETKVPGLKGEALKDMLDKFKAVGAPDLGNVNRRSKVGAIREALIVAIEKYNNGTWRIAGEDEGEGDESSDLGDDEPSALEPISDWEETDSED
ncbi:glutamic acid-rich protein [Coprinellus micaceus]|uniref:Glutamic acid-rich protein n=1 Tax=Coprinellus micaceus TaxID=71717 RepID=A0A4Y7SL25_COPMI|nr:glutamic acid-rich protein [Coprinellus micaceus]